MMMYFPLAYAFSKWLTIFNQKF